jgi:prophage DNA circulation protein
VRRASDAFIRESPRVVEVTTLDVTNVYAVAARTYPGEPFEARAEQILNLNDIPNPARIPGGTRLKVYARDTSSRLKTPRLRGASL